MKKMQTYALLLVASFGLLLSSCRGSDEPKGGNEIVKIDKKNDTAILLCTFGSTYELPQETYNAIMEDYKASYPEADIYLSYTSRTCINRVGAAINKYYAQPDLWLKAIGDAGYKVVGVQSLHVIPGEEFLSLMNTDVKKNFMIKYEKVKVAKGNCLLHSNGEEGESNDVDAVAKVLYEQFCKERTAKNEYVVLMGHGNPDNEYNHANQRYSQLEAALQKLDGGKKRIFVGTVDYGDMMFSYVRKSLSEAIGKPELNDPAKGTAQMPANNVKVHLIPLMSVAGDHAHNDMAGELEDGQSPEINPYESDHEAEYSWKLKLERLGYKTESHMKGLADFKDIRAIWKSHLDLSTAESWSEHLGE